MHESDPKQNKNGPGKSIEGKEKIKVVGMTEIHLGEIDKPNEDSWLSGSNVIAIADGITRSRLLNGRYPSENATIAPRSFVENVVKKLSTMKNSTTEDVRKIIVETNETIAQESGKIGIDKSTVDYQSLDLLGTTGGVLCVNPDRNKAIFAYLGDVVVIYLPKEGTPKLLTRDQLRACHNFSYSHFSQEQKAERLLWQRKEARNNLEARDPDGNQVGYGAFTGEPQALQFLKILEFPVKQGDRFILASDALRVTASVDKNEEESISSYESTLEVVNNTPFDKLPNILIKLIRKYEIEKKARSDDATIVVVEI